MVVRRNVDTREITRLGQIVGDVPIAHRLVHADVVRFLVRPGVLHGNEDCAYQIFHVNEVTQQRIAELLVVKAHGAAKVVLLLNPRRRP